MILSAHMGEIVVLNLQDYNLTMKSVLCDQHTYETMSQSIMDRVHPDIRREFEQAVNQLTADGMEEVAHTIKHLIPQTPYPPKF